METNLNCDLGEKSIHYDGKNDEALMKIINTASVACGYHAGNYETMKNTIKFPDTIPGSPLESAMTIAFFI